MTSTAVLCFVLFAAAPSEDAGSAAQELGDKVQQRAEALKHGVATFRLRLTYYGEQDKPFYGITLSVPSAAAGENFFDRATRIDKDQALRLIEVLKEQGFLKNAKTLMKGEAPKASVMPSYNLLVTTDELRLYEELGWDLSMLARLDGLRKVLGGQAAKDMDLLLGRISGFRAIWQAAAKAGN